MYCNYCGWEYTKRICNICRLTISICGCDFGRTTCKEHFCLECEEPHLELSDDGLCNGCEQEWIASETIELFTFQEDMIKYALQKGVIQNAD